jgi:hypothetical protein
MGWERIWNTQRNVNATYLLHFEMPILPSLAFARRRFGFRKALIQL